MPYTPPNILTAPPGWKIGDPIPAGYETSVVDSAGNLESWLSGVATYGESYTDTQVATRAPLSHTHPASDIASGTMAPARLGTGTASATTFLRGDQTWATPAAGGGTSSANPQPADIGLATWAFDPAVTSGASQPTAGTLYLARQRVSATTTFATAAVIVSVGGSGVTPLANCYLGLYDAAGTLRGRTADQATAWGTAGPYAPALTAEPSQSLAITDTDGYCYWGLLIGTQSTTPATFYRGSTTPGAGANFLQTAATTPPARWLSKTGQGAALPATITISTFALNTVPYWGGLG